MPGILTSLSQIAQVAVTSKTALAAHGSVAVSAPMWLPLVPLAWHGDGAAIAQLAGIVAAWAATIVFRWVTERKLVAAKAVTAL